MKTPLLFGLLLICFSLQAQDKFRIYYDNTDNSVVRFLGQPNVPLILAENQMSGFSTVNFSVSKEGKVTSIHNLLKSDSKFDNIFFRTAKEAIEKSSGHWIIKPGLNEQNFQVTFFITSEMLDSLRKVRRDRKDFKVHWEQDDSKVPLSQHVQYDGKPMELTILPTINMIFKQMVSKPKKLSDDTFTDH